MNSNITGLPIENYNNEECKLSLKDFLDDALNIRGKVMRLSVILSNNCYNNKFYDVISDNDTFTNDVKMKKIEFKSKVYTECNPINLYPKNGDYNENDLEKLKIRFNLINSKNDHYLCMYSKPGQQNLLNNLPYVDKSWANLDIKYSYELTGGKHLHAATSDYSFYQKDNLGLISFRGTVAGAEWGDETLGGTVRRSWFGYKGIKVFGTMFKAMVNMICLNKYNNDPESRNKINDITEILRRSGRYKYFEDTCKLLNIENDRKTKSYYPLNFELIGITNSNNSNIVIKNNKKPLNFNLMKNNDINHFLIKYLKTINKLDDVTKDLYDVHEQKEFILVQIESIDFQNKRKFNKFKEFNKINNYKYNDNGIINVVFKVTRNTGNFIFNGTLMDILENGIMNMNYNQNNQSKELGSDLSIKHLVITGHSRGGSIAQLFSYFVLCFYPEIKVYTYPFAGTRVGAVNIEMPYHYTMLQYNIPFYPIYIKNISRSANLFKYQMNEYLSQLGKIDKSIENNNINDDEFYSFLENYCRGSTYRINNVYDTVPKLPARKSKLDHLSTLLFNPAMFRKKTFSSFSGFKTGLRRQMGEFSSLILSAAGTYYHIPVNSINISMIKSNSKKQYFRFSGVEPEFGQEIFYRPMLIGLKNKLNQTGIENISKLNKNEQELNIKLNDLESYISSKNKLNNREKKQLENEINTENIIDFLTKYLIKKKREDFNKILNYNNKTIERKLQKYRDLIHFENQEDLLYNFSISIQGVDSNKKNKLNKLNIIENINEIQDKLENISNNTNTNNLLKDIENLKTTIIDYFVNLKLEESQLSNYMRIITKFIENLKIIVEIINFKQKIFDLMKLLIEKDEFKKRRIAPQRELDYYYDFCIDQDNKNFTNYKVIGAEMHPLANGYLPILDRFNIVNQPVIFDLSLKFSCLRVYKNMFKNFKTKKQNLNYKKIIITPYKIDKERYYYGQNAKIMNINKNCYQLLPYDFKLNNIFKNNYCKFDYPSLNNQFRILNRENIQPLNFKPQNIQLLNIRPQNIPPHNDQPLYVQLPNFQKQNISQNIAQNINRSGEKILQDLLKLKSPFLQKFSKSFYTKLLEQYKKGEIKSNDIKEILRNFRKGKINSGVKYRQQREIINKGINSGGSQFINIPNYGKRKIRYLKNGKAYVIVKGKKLKLKLQ